MTNREAYRVDRDSPRLSDEAEARIVGHIKKWPRNALETWRGTADSTGKQQTGYFDPFSEPTAMAETQALLRGQLFDHLKKTRDPRVVGGTVDWDYYPYCGKISTKGWRVDEKPQ